MKSQNYFCGLNYTVTDSHFASTKTKLQHFPQDEDMGRHTGCPSLLMEATRLRHQDVLSKVTSWGHIWLAAHHIHDNRRHMIQEKTGLFLNFKPLLLLANFKKKGKNHTHANQLSQTCFQTLMNFNEFEVRNLLWNLPVFRADWTVWCTIPQTE